MPYSIKKVGSKFKIINKDTGKVVGSSDTKEKAQSSIRARLAGDHGWVGSGKKRSKK